TFSSSAPIHPHQFHPVHCIFAQTFVSGLNVSKRAIQKYRFCFEEWHFIPRDTFRRLSLSTFGFPLPCVLLRAASKFRHWCVVSWYLVPLTVLACRADLLTSHRPRPLHTQTRGVLTS